MLLFVGLTFALNANSEEGEWVFQLWDINHNDAPISSLGFSVEPKVTFNDDQLIVTTKYYDVDFYDLNSIRKITYYFKLGTGINDIAADSPLMKFIGNDVVFTALKTGDNISVFTTNGIQVINKVITTNGDFTLPLSNLDQGVYLINVNGKTFKIVKK